MSFIISPGVIVPPLTAGGVAYGTGSQAKVTSAGTAGQVLTSAGAGVPVFQTISAPALVLVSSATANNSAAIAFTGLTTVYRAYILEFDSVYFQSASDSLLAQISTNNGVSYLATGYQRTLIYNNSAVVIGLYSAATTQMIIAGAGGGSNVSTQTASGTFTIFAPAVAGKNASTYLTSNSLNGGVLENLLGSQSNTTTSAVNAFKLYAGSGNITGGNFRLYGLANT